MALKTPAPIFVGSLVPDVIVDLPIITGHPVARITNVASSGGQIFVRSDGLAASVTATPIGPGEAIELRIDSLPGVRPVVSLVASAPRIYRVELRNRLSTSVQQTRILSRPAGDWYVESPVLADGQLGFDETSFEFRVGDGMTPWNALMPIGGAPSGGLTVEQVQDIVGNMVDGSANIDVSYNDPAGALTVSAPDVASLDEAGHIARSYRPDLDRYNVKDYGAVGDGVTDDTSTLNTVLALLAHSTDFTTGANKTVYVPKGRYRITDTIEGGNSLSHCLIYGDGQHATEFVWDGPAGVPMFQFDNALNITMRDLGVIGNSSARPSHGVRLHRTAGQVGSPSASKFHMVDCWVGAASADSMECGVAFTADAGFNSNNDMATFDRTVIFNVWIGIWFSHTNALWNNVTNCYIAKCKTACISTVPDIPHSFGGSFQVRGGNFFTMPTEGTVFLAGPNNSGNTNDVYGMNCESSHQLLVSAVPITTGVGGWRFFGGHANVNDASPIGSVNMVDFDTTVADVEFHAVDIRQPSGSYLSFPGTGAKVSFFGGKVGLDILEYNCKIAFFDTTVYGGTSTYTNLGSGTITWAGGTSNSSTTKALEYPTVKALGLTGATANSRYVGSTTSGFPLSGTFTLGDWLVARDGFVHICTTGGTPGTWTRTGLRFPSGQTVAVLGPDMLANGSFATDLAGWTGANWVATAGGAQHQAGAVTSLSQTIASGLVNGGYYQVTVVISGRTAGSVTFVLGSATSACTASDTATVTAGGPSGDFSITPTSDFDGTIDSVGLQLISASTPQMFLDTSVGSTIGEIRASTNQIGLGLHALAQNSTGATNTAVGADAVYRNVTGNANTGVGYRALRDNVDGNSNTAIGVSALQSNMVGLANTAVGVNAGLSNTTGNNSVAIGHSAMNTNLTGQAITAVGQQAYTSVIAGPNTAVGRSAGYAPNGITANATSTAIRQTIIGNEAGQASTTQRDHIVAIGDSALVDGNGAIALGSGASAGAAGAVAIGRSSAGTPATTTTANEFKFGTLSHTYNFPGVSWSIADGATFTLGTVTGTVFGAATNQKWATHGATPTVQRVGVAQTAVATTAATTTTPYGFSTQAQADAIVTLVNELRAMAVEKGFMKGSA